MSVRTRRVNLQQAFDRMARAPRVLVTVDFDGTIAPIVDDPYAAAADPKAVDALAGLARLQGTTVAILSGRGYTDLVARAGKIPGVRFIGGHGTEHDGDGAQDDLTLVRSRFKEVVDRLPGSWIEEKNHSLGLHYRAVHSERLEPELEALRAWTAGRDDLHPLENKRIFEVGIRPLSKGSAVEELRGAIGASAVFYAGDDNTDESVFSVLEKDDVGVKVGAGETKAAFRVAGVPEMCETLHELLRTFATRRRSAV